MRAPPLPRPLLPVSPVHSIASESRGAYDGTPGERSRHKTAKELFLLKSYKRMQCKFWKARFGVLTSRFLRSGVFIMACVIRRGPKVNVEIID